MSDADLEADLAAAFLTPSAGRPELAEAVMARVRRADRRRRIVIAAFGLAGAGLAVAAVAATGVIDRGAIRELANLVCEPTAVAAVGLALIAAAAARHALGDA